MVKRIGEFGVNLAIVVAYFGQLPNTTKFWLKSCEKNSDIDFYLITDQKVECTTIPHNVFYIKSSVRDFEKRVEKRLGIICDLRGRTYKICDYRPLFNIIYEDVIGKYDYFGQCELDMIFGKINHFICENQMYKYKKLFNYGHFTIYKNDDFLFRQLDTHFGGGYSYRELLGKKELCNSDEQFHPYSINRLYDTLNIPIYEEMNGKFADIAQDCYRFILWNHKTRQAYKEKKKRIIFTWQNGELYGYYLLRNKIVKDEYLYIHLQKRVMTDYVGDNINDLKYIIIPNRFIPYQEIGKTIIFENSRNKLIYRQWFMTHINGVKLRIKRRITKDYANCEVGNYIRKRDDK